MSIYQQNLVTIRTYDNYITANIVRERLDFQGIYAVIKDEQTVTMNWLWSNAIGGIKLQVLEQDVEKATEILQKDESTYEAQTESDAFTSEDKTIYNPNNKICIYCGSKNTNPIQYDKNWAYTALLFLGFPIAKKSNKWHCFHCKKDF
jgi:hypothetical protein